MTTHQDNAARYARIAQIAAVVLVVVAVGVFIAPLPAQEISTGDPARTGGGVDLPSQPEEYHFSVPEQDWTVALEPLSAGRDPVIASANGNGDRFGGIENGEDDNGEEGTPPSSPRQRPMMRYLGSLGDNRGIAGLLEYAGKQRFVRKGDEFDGYEVVEVHREFVTVSDGFDEFTFEIAVSILAEITPNPVNPMLNRARNRGNPNAFPPGRPQPSPTTRQPTEPQNEDEGAKEEGDGGSPA